MSKPEPAQAQAQAQPQAQTGALSADQVAQLKSGEYLIHVYIEETRALRHPKYEDQTIDPIIQVEAFGEKRLSKAKERVGTGATFWGEHFFFEKNFNTTFEVEVERITISVLDHNSFGLDALIGSVDFNLSAIYYKDKHCMMYQWTALSGLTKNFQNVLGFLKFSIGVFAPKDEQIVLDQEKITDAAAGPNAFNVLYPPQISTQPYQLRIKVFRGENLKKMDTWGQCDPYVEVQYGNAVAQTDVIKVTLEPVWNQELFVPVSLPTINDRITVKLYDWEKVGTNELLGSCSFKIEDIKNKKYKTPFWVNIYGAPSGAKDKWGNAMNNVPETATEWKGRIQLALSMDDSAQPILGMFQIKDPKIVETSSKIRREKFELRMDIHYALNLPKNDVKYHVKVKWGKSEVATSKKNSDKRMIEIYESFSLTEEFPCGTQDEIEIPDIFIYINDGDKNFSFIRKPWTHFADPALKAKSFFFQNDKSKTSKRDDLAGVVKMRLCANRAGQNQQALAQYGWTRPVQKPASQTNWKIYLNIYQARDLASGDSSGLSDPYVVAYFNGQEDKTTTINDSVNPIWNERKEFNARFDTWEEAPPIMLTLWDEDKGSLSNDFLGSAMVQISQASLNPSILPNPTWVPFLIGKKGQECGKVLLSVCCYNRQELIPRNPYIEPEMQKYYINMKILGLRDLQSAGLLPVKRAFVKFDIDSLKRNQEKSWLPEKKALRTEPLESGNNPNILTVINVEVMLPVDPEFCPSMACTVFDYILKGASQPRIGNFAIPLGEFIKETKRELNKRIDTLTKFYYANQEAFQKKKADFPRPLGEPVEEEKETLLQQVELVVDKDVSKIEEPEIDIETLLKSDDPVAKARASEKFVIHPVMNAEGVEDRVPNPNTHMSLGHTKKDLSSKKHYRYYINQELETSGLIDASPFTSIPIFRGKQVTDDNLFMKLFSFQEDYKNVGYFKTMINIMSDNDKKVFDSKIATVAQFANTKGLEFSDEEFLQKRDVTVRLYIIQADGLPAKDDDSNSDPYVVVKLGKTKYSEKDNYQKDTSDPKIHKCYEFPASIPGASRLSIEFYDYDHLTADDFIGKTEIDIEDRWYSRRWRSLTHIPIETRKLYHPSSKIPQGTVKLWLEILPKDQKVEPIWQIAPKPSMEFELRVVVWECKGVPKVDIEDAVDIYITATLEDGQELRTDTHFRSQDGKGSFNWRMVFKTLLPMKKSRISFKIWDKDLLTKNDYISEATFDFDTFTLRAFEKEEVVHVTNEVKENKFWLKCANTQIKDGKANVKELGEILVSMALVPKTQANLSPVGQGRSNPNQNPYLPPPTGRMSLTWNPIKMFEQLVGPMARAKICAIVAVICLVFFGVMFIPMFLAAALAS